MTVQRRQCSWKATTHSYSLSKDEETEIHGPSFSGTVVTPHGLVSVHSNVYHPTDQPAKLTRSFAMAYRGRMYHRWEDGAALKSVRHGAVLAGKFARDVAEGRIP